METVGLIGAAHLVDRYDRGTSGAMANTCSKRWPSFEQPAQILNTRYQQRWTRLTLFQTNSLYLSNDREHCTHVGRLQAAPICHRSCTLLLGEQVDYVQCGDNFTEKITDAPRDGEDDLR